MEDHGGHQLQSHTGTATLSYVWEYTPGGAPFEDHEAAAAAGVQSDYRASSTASNFWRARAGPCSTRRAPGGAKA
jgi:hypothetical protein